MDTKFVDGIYDFKLNLGKVTENLKLEVYAAVGETTAGVVNHAKANHADGAHASQRYENQTSLLTNSMRVDMQVEGSQIIGMASANREYAADVELGTPESRAYPYMFPALAAHANIFMQNLVKHCRLRRH